MSKPLPQRFPFLALGSLALACSGPPGAGLLRGDDQGTFEVDAVQVDSSCGEGALGSAPQWQFEVDLSASPTELFWDGRASSRLDDSKFQLSIRGPVAQSRAAATPTDSCTIARIDTISGVLELETDSIVGLVAQLRYGYAPTPSSRCGPGAAAEAGLAQLPCTMLYDLTAKRVRAPGE